MKIMIVDDHADMRRVLRNYVTLAYKGSLEIVECKSGEEALGQYQEEKPDCVLMDIELKSMSGFKVTEEILKKDNQAQVIIVTSYDTIGFRKKAKRTKAKGFVSKDNLSDLNQIIKNITIQA